MVLFDLIDNNSCVLITGGFGIGKTHKLKEIAIKYGTIILSNNPSIKELELLTGEKFKSNKEAYSKILQYNRRVLIFDDVHESRKDTISSILRLSKIHTIICASEKDVERLKYDFSTVKMKRLSFEASMNICKFLVSDENACRRICEKANGLPLLVIRGAEYYRITGDVKNYFRKDWKKGLLKSAAVTAYLFLSIRYFARVYNNWELYSIMSSIAYALLALTRVSKRI